MSCVDFKKCPLSLILKIPIKTARCSMSNLRNVMSVIFFPISISYNHVACQF